MASSHRRRAALLAAAGAIVASIAAPAPGMAADRDGSPPIVDPALLLPSHEQFSLPNGLRVVVHTDHKVPIVSAIVLYDVGSQNEPAGKTGFAHLFEHLMFQGTENYTGEFFAPFQLAGASGQNASTFVDRTVYFETVPTPALDMMLWMESDRMGHLLGAIDQKTLDEQRGVVKNEKRQREGQPYGLVGERLYAGVFPVGHPYHHLPIGSMSDIDAASLGDVKTWFSNWYGPNNAILVLSGDIDLATAKAKVARYFGDIGPSAAQVPPRIPIPRLPRDTVEVMSDRVPMTLVSRAFPAAEATSTDAVPLQMVAMLLGAGPSSRLSKRLVHDERLASSASAGFTPMRLAGLFTLQAQLLPDVDRKRVERVFGEEVARFIAEGPTRQEIDDVRNAQLAEYAQAEQMGMANGQILGNCVLLGKNPGCIRDDLAQLMSATPASLQAVARRWLSGGSYTLEVVPGADNAKSLSEEGAATIRRTPMTVMAPDPRFHADRSDVDRKLGVPAVPTTVKLTLPPFRHATLSNGIPVTLVERHDAPVMTIGLQFEGAAFVDKAGLASVGATMLGRGAGDRDAVQSAARVLELGTNVSVNVADGALSIVSSTLPSRLPDVAALMADVARRPRFDADELERARASALSNLGVTRINPVQELNRLSAPILYGPDHPLGQMVTDGALKSITRADLTQWQAARLTPGNLRITVVGDTTLAKLMPVLEREFGNWSSPARADRSASVAEVSLPSAPRIVIVDKPGAKQATIFATHLLPAWKADDYARRFAANLVLGGTFTSRLNMNLREDKHWTYGAQSAVTPSRYQSPWQMVSQIETDQVAPAMREMATEVERLRTTAPPTPTDMQRVHTQPLALPATIETNGILALLVMRQGHIGQPDDNMERFVRQMQTMTSAAATVGAQALQPSAITWLVMGDRAQIEGPIRKLGMAPVTVVDSDGRPVTP